MMDRQHGQQLNERILLAIDPDLKSELRALANSERSSISAVIRRLIVEKVRQHKNTGMPEEVHA